MSRSRAVRRPLWLITKHENGRIKTLTVAAGTGEKALPVFSFEEEAEVFLRFERLEGAWRVRETTTGELVSVLYGPCAGVSKVALDPLPVAGCEVMTDLVSLGRERFVRCLMGDCESLAAWRSPLGVELSGGSDPLESLEERAGQMKSEATWYKARRVSGKALYETDYLAIPDYVMRDFGSFEGSVSVPGIRRRPSRVSDTNASLL